jgi:hypothetical protein
MKTLAILALGALLAPAAIAAPKQDTLQTQATSGQPIVLDRVIAIVNNEVLLQSDVDQEQRLAALSPLAVPRGQDTQAEAARRLIRRTLVLEQMKLQDQPTSVSQADAERGLQELRATLHGCAPYSCSSQQGWNNFLKDHDITQKEALERWSQRLAIEKFINLRFRAGIHITSAEVSAYYNHTLIPALRENQVPVPPLKQVASRIEQLLLEQHVNFMISQWLQSLRAEGSVQILVPAYGKSTPSRPDSDQ